MIRPGRASDVDDIIKVDLSAGALFAGTHMAWAVGQHSSAAQLLAAMERDMLWVWDDRGGLGAYLMAEPMDGCFYIDEVAVHDRYQRRGLGRSLIEHALREAAGRGFRQATLTTDRELAWNAPYYERLGFRVMAGDELPPELAARLASQPNPGMRCAMIRDL